MAEAAEAAAPASNLTTGQSAPPLAPPTSQARSRTTAGSYGTDPSSALSSGGSGLFDDAPSASSSSSSFPAPPTQPSATDPAASPNDTHRLLRTAARNDTQEEEERGHDAPLDQETHQRPVRGREGAKDSRVASEVERDTDRGAAPEVDLHAPASPPTASDTAKLNATFEEEHAAGRADVEVSVPLLIHHLIRWSFWIQREPLVFRLPFPPGTPFVVTIIVRSASTPRCWLGGVAPLP